MYAAYTYGLSVSGALLVFGLFVLRLRMVAPGARSLLEAVLARFGTRVHLMMCIFSLINNLGITCGLIAGEFCTYVFYDCPTRTQ